MFADKGIVSPYKEGMAFMFRVANKLNHQLQNAEARLIASFLVEENGHNTRQYFELELE